MHIILKDAPIPAGSALQLLDGGAKMVVQNGDRMFFNCAASSLDVWVSRVDSISTYMPYVGIKSDKHLQVNGNNTFLSPSGTSLDFNSCSSKC